MAWPETVRKADLDIEWFSGTGAGGQYRNKHRNCCRMKHQPTGIVTTGQSHRERPANQLEAWSALVAKLVPLMRAAAQRSGEIETTSGERIRTYNIAKRRVTDHRIPHRQFDPDSILDGKLDQIFQALRTEKP